MSVLHKHNPFNSDKSRLCSEDRQRIEKHNKDYEEFLVQMAEYHKQNKGNRSCTSKGSLAFAAGQVNFQEAHA